MFDHIGLHVRNLDASIAFYQAALAPLGHDGNNLEAVCMEAR